MRTLYNVLLYLAAPFALLRLLWKSLRLPAYRARIGERFGFVARPRDDIAVWLHAVSVGETLAALPLIRALVQRHGPGRVWVTTTTPTGSERVLAALGAQVRHSYAPYDLPDAVARFLRRVRPRQVIVMETELWPNLFRQCARRGLDLYVVNARLSARSLRRYQKIAGLARDTIRCARGVLAQSRADARRLRRLGAAPDSVQVAGNLKFDLSVPPEQCAQGQALRARFGRERPVWLAASTHEGEEEVAITAHQALLAQQPQALLILVPRHPQRFDGVAKLLTRSGLTWCRRSALGAGFEAGSSAAAGPQEPVNGAAGQAAAMTADPAGEVGARSVAHSSSPAPADCAVLLGDSMGEMFMYLAAADIAFIGGSLVPVGGHNVLEPAALGLPVLFGPHMFNFAAARSLLLGCGAALEVADTATLAQAVLALMAQPARCAALGQAGVRAVAASRGALQRALIQLGAA